LSTKFQIGVMTVFVGKGWDSDENIVTGETFVGADFVVFVFCMVEMNKGLFNCVILELVVNGNLVSTTSSSLVL